MGCITTELTTLINCSQLLFHQKEKLSYVYAITKIKGHRVIPQTLDSTESVLKEQLQYISTERQ